MAHGGARQHVPPRRPRHLAFLHPPDDVQKQLRRQVRPPTLLLLLPLLQIPLMGPRVLGTSMAMSGHRPFRGSSSAVASSPRHAPHPVPHLLQLTDEALKRHFDHPLMTPRSKSCGACGIRRKWAKLGLKLYKILRNSKTRNRL
ncbi:hypothetical protein GW17_00051210 [Ensete ventricosum]|nr:hypothetical protein GW17_00051210 [Ensete ventricosum]